MAEPDRYPIGALARLAGVPVETLRTWERRYGFPTPVTREDGARLYDGEEVARVRAMAELNRRGERVRDLAPMSRAMLEERLTTHRARPQTALPDALRVVALLPCDHEDLAGVSPSGLTRTQVVARGVTALELPELPDPVDVLVVASDDPEVDLLAQIDAASERVRPKAVVVRSTFMNSLVRQGLGARNVRLVTDPRPTELRRAVEEAAVMSRVADGALPSPSAARRLEVETLRRLMTTPSTVACECLNHLAAIAFNLDAFERYSRGCEAAGGADAELHGALAEGAAQALTVVEALLVRTAGHEGIRI